MNPPSIPNSPKKGTSPLAMIGFGCLGLVVVAGIGSVFAMKACSAKVQSVMAEVQKNPGKAMAIIMVKANPDLELVKTDDATGEITVRDKKSGEVTTLSFDDASEGKFKMKNAKGEEVTIDTKAKDGKAGVVVKTNEGTTVIGGDSQATTAPAWVPQYPGIKAKNGGMRAEKTDSVNGMFFGETQDAPAKVKAFYESKLKAAGFQVEGTNVVSGATEMMTLHATKDDDKTKVNATISLEQGQKTQVMLQYDGPKS